MRNPLPATLWFLLHDARNGLIEADGFERAAVASTDHTVFRRGNFHFHSDGFWLDQPESRLVYRNTCRAFYRLPKERNPLSTPEAGEEKVALEEGFLAVRDILRSHEAFVQERCGRGYRNRLLAKMPTSERRYGKNWKLAFGVEPRPVHM